MMLQHTWNIIEILQITVGCMYSNLKRGLVCTHIHDCCASLWQHYKCTDIK
jgi:hypothetical protein